MNNATEIGNASLMMPLFVAFKPSFSMYQGVLHPIVVAKIFLF